jgi:hypothetical protein
MSRQTEDRNSQRFAEKMREKSMAAKNAKQAAKKAPSATAPSPDADGNKKG